MQLTGTRMLTIMAAAWSHLRLRITLSSGDGNEKWHLLFERRNADKMLCLVLDHIDSPDSLGRIAAINLQTLLEVSREPSTPFFKRRGRTLTFR